MSVDGEIKNKYILCEISRKETLNMENLEIIFKEAQTCKKCSSIPSDVIYRKHEIHPVPWFVKNFVGERVKIIFVLQSAGTAIGGAARTGKLSDVTNFDQTAKNAMKLRELANIADSDCFFTNSILHAAITEEGKMRNPTEDEIIECSPFLKRIIDSLNPWIVAPVGNAALKALNIIEPHPFEKITSCAGKEFNWYDRIAFPLVHWSPKGLINRNWNLQVRDFKLLRTTLDRILSRISFQ